MAIDEVKPSPDWTEEVLMGLVVDRNEFAISVSGTTNAEDGYLGRLSNITKEENMLNRIILSLFVLLVYAVPIYGDMGRILTYDVDVREDYQKAIILHNLDEEVLILGTDLVSDRKTKILRFIPMPSEPKITLAEGNPLEFAFKLIKKHNLSFIFATKSMSEASSTPVEMRFSARLGAHDVTVIKINQTGEFSDWVQKFLNSKELPLGKGYQQVVEVAVDYVERGIKYFVFDLVDVTPEVHFVEPIVYRFKSKKLYYPLKTSNTFGGSGGIDLIIIAPVTLCNPLVGEDLYSQEKELYSRYPCMGALSKKNPFSYPVTVSTSAEISREEAESVYAPAGNFFQEGESIFMQLIRYHGKYDFEDDILIDISKAPREEYGQSPPNGIVPPLELFLIEKNNKLK